MNSKKMVATKNKNKVLSCSTPEHHQAESPSRDSDSLCDSEAASPVPFLCTQDGAEGETDVVWNFYTPKSEHAASTRLKNTTPLSRKTKKSLKNKLIEKPLPRRRPVRPSQKNTQLFQELIELNQNLHNLIAKKPQTNGLTDKQSGSEDDIFNDSPEYSPKSALKTNSRCLRKNVLSSKFSKPEAETALESDDSMNECLLKASQMVEENVLGFEPTSAKRPRYETNNLQNSNLKFKMDQDSMDAILKSIKLDSPVVRNVKKVDSPNLKNDSFDSLVGNLNDSALEQLTQMPVKSNVSTRRRTGEDTNWTIKELVVHDCSPSKSVFGRHNSMPESPSVVDVNKPSTSGMVFGRYSSMPYNNNGNNKTDLGDSPIRCTPDEIKRKHQQAREKLLAKRLLPFTSTQKPTQITSTQNTQNFSQISTLATQQSIPVIPTVPKKAQFKPRIATTATKINNNTQVNANVNTANNTQVNTNSMDLKMVIERKRQEALMKLRRRQPQK